MADEDSSGCKGNSRWVLPGWYEAFDLTAVIGSSRRINWPITGPRVIERSWRQSYNGNRVAVRVRHQESRPIRIQCQTLRTVADQSVLCQSHVDALNFAIISSINHRETVSV